MVCHLRVREPITQQTPVTPPPSANTNVTHRGPYPALPLTDETAQMFGLFFPLTLETGIFSAIVCVFSFACTGNASLLVTHVISIFCPVMLCLLTLFRVFFDKQSCLISVV